MRFPHPIQAYIVGGAVRDQLLGLPAGDRDWVVVGATPEWMLSQGFRPVGKDFPVFLHPLTQEEYALARTERKMAPGYHGFTFHAAPDVTLEQDLARRDLTINAMAMSPEGEIIDPFNGRADLTAGLLRHVSPAFAEDPVRILRVARFAARFGFTLTPETLQLMRDMSANGEVNALVPERVWQEMSRALMTDTPSHFFLTLREADALARVMPEIDALFGVPQPPQYHPEIDTGIHVMQALDYAARSGWPLTTRFAVLCHDLGKALTPTDILPRHIGHEARGEQPLLTLCERLRVPAECRDLARMTVLQHTHVHQAGELRAATVLKLFKHSDALRRPERFRQMLDACLADARGRTGFDTTPYPQASWLDGMLTATLTLDAGALARQIDDKHKLPQAIDQARISLIEQWRQQHLQG